MIIDSYKMEHCPKDNPIDSSSANRSSRLPALLFATLILQSPCGFAETIEHSQEIPGSCSLDSECTHSNAKHTHWLESSRKYVTVKSDSLAGWLDDFFGTPTSDLESASSSLRLRLRGRWEEGEGNDFKASLRGNIHLPRASKRLSLIFTEAVEEGTDESGAATEIIDDSKDNTDVSVQYNVLENIRSRLDLHFGLRSSLKPKVSGRYRYRMSLIEDYFAEFSEKVYFKGGDGFGSITRFSIDHTLASDQVLRWSNRFHYAEESDGVEWSSNLSLNQRLDEKRAIAYVVGTAGETRPDYLNTRYGMSVVYRQNFLRPWLFVELEPAYKWKRPNREDDRDGVAQLTAKLEIRFAED